MNKSIIYIILALFFVACKKDNIEPEKNLYATIEIDDLLISYSVNDSVYSDGASYSYTYGGWSPSFTYGGGFINMNQRLGTYFNVSSDQFIVIFRNISLDSIKPGNYNFVGENNT